MDHVQEVASSSSGIFPSTVENSSGYQPSNIDITSNVTIEVDHNQSFNDISSLSAYANDLNYFKNLHQTPPNLSSNNTVSSGLSGNDDGDCDSENDTNLCQTGTEQTGRWTKKEHELFLEGLQKFGKEWKKVAANVKTRTVVQTRTHAQKYFQKALGKVFTPDMQGLNDLDGGLGALTAIPMRTKPTHANSSSGPKKPRIAPPPMMHSLPPGDSSSQFPPYSHRPPPFGGGGYDQQLALGIGPPGYNYNEYGEYYPLVDNDPTMAGMGGPIHAPYNNNVAYPDDYFYYDVEMNGPTIIPPGGGHVDFDIPSDQLPYSSGGRMKYDSNVLSTPDNSMYLPNKAMRLDLPPPSPASCGKRKAAELAVAQGLANVLSATPRSSSSQDIANGINALAMLKTAGKGSRVTDTRPTGRPAMTLSIINPDTLPSFKGHRQDVQTPSTPWDGELLQLETQSHFMNASTVVPVLTTAEQNGFISKVCSAVLAGDRVHLASLIQEATLSDLLVKSSSCSPILDMDHMITDEFHVPASFSLKDEDKPPALALFASPLPANKMLTSSAHNSGRNINHFDSGSVKDNSKCDYSAVISEMINRVNDRGESALMMACSAVCTKKFSQNVILDICKSLLECGALSGLTNREGKNCLHLLAECGYDIVAKLLLHRGCPINDADINGDTAYHIAAKYGQISFIELLANCGANCHIHNYSAKCPLDCSLEFIVEKTPEQRTDFRKLMMIQEPRLRTLVLYHEDCLEHCARLQSDWEGPDRLSGIMATLCDQTIFPPYMVEISNQFEKAQVELLRRVHSPEYIAFVNSLSKKMQQSGTDNKNANPTMPFTPQVQISMFHKPEDKVKLAEHCDTSFSAGTLKASRRAAGAVAHAVDMVLLGRNRNAFCVVRPPGHHAGYRGLLDGAKSCGFCIFNSVAAGALHALEAHKCERVAIVDIDIHHGNGTEDIVRRYPHPSRLLFFSVHLYDKEEAYEFFPGSGVTDDTMHNIINVPLTPMWQESGSTAHGTRSKNSSPSVTAVPVGRDAFKQAITQRLIPSLRAFCPDLILLSTGFDPAIGDVGNLRNNGLANGLPAPGMNLRTWDFEWVTSEMIKIADLCCNGRLVSVLEGGYGANPPVVAGQQSRLAAAGRIIVNKPSSESSVPVPPQGGVLLDRSILSNAASAHVMRLCDPYGLGPSPPN